MQEEPPLSPERWQQVKELLGAALEREPPQRPAFLAAACASDAELRAEVESLLALEDQAASFIEVPAMEVPAYDLSTDGCDNPTRGYETSLTPPPLAAPHAGQRIGPYKVLREIGRGGMGAVYLASRADDQYRKQVGIKLIRRGLDSDFVLQRFRNERQILAALDHPNIARLLDGGTTEDGLPYLVMEYIEGTPLDAYCDSHKLTTMERLKLFRQVCAAVHYAHQHLVIHRDLKPSNTLVTKEGVPKLLDFGIAKLLTPELASQTLDPTAPELRLMTPAYASPEQVKGEPITTASDVYSLGVILYELLTGRSPYRQTSQQMHEVMHAVCQQEPERPSTAITRGAKTKTADEGRALTAEAVSQSRDTQPDKLRRRLKGDVDNIVLMALRKEPQRRYASVEQFSEDIQRHLDGLPVIARKDTLGYRSAKFIQRNKWGVVAAALILLTLVGGIVTTMQQRARAERRFNEVRKLAHAVMFDYHDAIEKLPGSTAVRERLVKDALQYLDRLSQEAGNDSSLQRELAAAYEKIGSVQGNSYNSNLGDTAGAMKSYRKSLELRQRLAQADPNNRALQDELASSDEGVGDMLYTVGELKSGLQSYEQGLKIRQSLLAADSSNSEFRRALAALYAKIGDIKGMDGYPNLGDTAGALEAYRQAVKLREELFAAAPEKREFRSGLAQTLTPYGFLANAAGDFETAVESGRRAITLLEAHIAADPNDATNQSNLGAAYVAWRQALVDSGRLPEAIECDRKAVRLMEAMAAADQKNTFLRRNLSVSYNALGRDLKAADEPSAAIENHRRALEINEALMAADPQSEENQDDVAFTLQRLAEAQAAMRDYHAALANYHRAAAIKEARIKAGSTNTRDREDLATIKADLAQAMMATGDLNTALAEQGQAISLAEAASTQSPNNLKIESRLALRHFELGELQTRLAQTRSSSAEQTAHWQAAREAYQRSLSLWQELSSQGKLTKADASKPDEAARALSKCDAALAMRR